MANNGTVQVEIIGGPSITVPWFQGMNAQQALEGAYNQVHNTAAFTYALQYYGSGLGYLVVMVNETYDSFVSSADPFFYWEFFVNGQPAGAGIDNTILNDGDVVAFGLEMYDPTTHSASLLRVKHAAQKQALGG